MKEKYLHELHADHKTWSEQLRFSKDEIESYKKRLEEVVQANTKTEVLAQVEHFQNQFIRQFEVIDTLLHDIHEEEHKITENAKANNVATDHRKVQVNEQLEDRMSMFNKIFDELKDEFKSYLTQVL